MHQRLESKVQSKQNVMSKEEWCPRVRRPQKFSWRRWQQDWTFSLNHNLVDTVSVPQLFLTLRPHRLQPTQPSLSFTISQSLPKLMSIESLMPSNHLALCHPLLLLPSVFPSIRGFFLVSWLFTSVGQILELQLQQRFFQWIFRIDFL